MSQSNRNKQNNQNSQDNQKILTAQEKANAALEAACAIQSVDWIAQKYGVYPTQIEEWKQKLIEKSPKLFTDHVHFACLQPPCNDFIFGAKPIKEIKSLTLNNVLIFKNLNHKNIKKITQPISQFKQQEDVKEKERKRIAREIHDDLGQNLLAMRLDILALQKHTAHDHPRLHEIVNIVLDNVDTTIQSVKSIVNDLRPFVLDLGLEAAIAWLLKTFERISGIHYGLFMNEANFNDFNKTSCAQCARTLNDEQTLAIFRILQEALNNIVRHSFATKVEIIISHNEYLFSMTVKDNGIGIHPQNERKNSSFGIIGIKERLHLLNGTCMINGKHGTGTTLRVAIPMLKKSSHARY